MVSTLSFIQANLKHSIAAFSFNCRTVSVKGIDMTLIQEPWYREGSIRGLKNTVYTLFSANETDIRRAFSLMRNETSWMLPSFSCWNKLTILIKMRMGQNNFWFMFRIPALRFQGYLLRQRKMRNLYDNLKTMILI